MSKQYAVALMGNPNSGKTTAFNSMTGAHQHVGNYPGITVEKKEGYAKRDDTSFHIVDLPGTYSLTAYSQEELVARNVLIDEHPDAVIDVLNAGSLERNLYLAVQLMELGAPIILALNMMDEARKKGISIDTARLAERLKAPVVETVARVGRGMNQLLEKTAELAEARANTPWPPLCISYGPDLDPVIQEMVALIEKQEFLTDRYPARWLAVKYLEGDEEIRVMGRRTGKLSHDLEAMADKVGRHCRATLKMDPEAIIADYRYGYIASLLKDGVVIREDRMARLELSDRMDKVLTQRLLGPMIMLGVLLAVYQITFSLGDIPMGWVESFFSWLGDTVWNALPEGQVRSLLVSGVIGGVGGVLGFVPLILIIFLLVAFLEDSGYMARVAYMMDRVFRMFGLHGSSVMPFIISGGIGGGCAVPGVLASRTLRSPKEKLATMLTAPFMTCGAKLPLFILLAGVFFAKHQATAMFLITLAGWALALVAARVLRSTVISGPPTPFVMELPPYRLPTLRGLLIHTWERTWQYIKKAGTVILAISILIWAAMTYPQLPETERADFAQQREQALAVSEQAAAEVDNLESETALRHSTAGRLGAWLEPVSGLSGFDWRTNIALIGGFAAKEVIVSTLGTAYSLGESDPEEAEPLAERISTDPNFDTATALALIVFVLAYSPCFVTLVTIAKESSWKWAAFASVYSTALAFGLAVGTYQLANVLGA